MKVISQKDDSGKLTYSTEIVTNVVECALNEIEGLIKINSNKKNQKQAQNYIRVDYVDDFLYIDIFVKLAFNTNVSEVASKVQSTVKNAIETMTAFKVKDINVHVVDVDFLE